MTFAHPLYLGIALVVALVFAGLALVSARRSRGAALAYSDLAFLERAIGRALQSDLLASPGVSQVWAEPFPGDGERDFDVSVEVTRFEGAATGSGRYVASLSAIIEISAPGANPRIVARRQFTAPDESWAGGDFARLAGLLSADVAALAREVLAEAPAKG